VRFVLDPGPNAATQRFAATVTRSTEALLPAGVDMEIGRPADDPSRSFQQTFEEMERADVAVCSDSFAAHLAPLFGCTTLVVAADGLERWRAPHRSSFYFSAGAPIDESIAAMRQVLRAIGIAPEADGGPPPVSACEQRLERASRALEDLFGDRNGDVEPDAVFDAYRRVVLASIAVARRLGDWPPQFRGLVSDVGYDRALPPLEGWRQVPDHLRPDLILHVKDRWQQWQTTNVRKYLRIVLDEAESAVTPRWSAPSC
jgi:hypothetical protein